MKKDKKLNFLVSEETDSLLRKTARLCDMKLEAVVRRGIEMFAKEKGVTK